MKMFPLLHPGISLALFTLFLLPSVPMSAQAAETAATKPIPLEELSQSELLKSYLQLREQLHTMQLAIMNNRLEAEATARAQAATIADRLEAITAAMESERARHRVEIDRYNTDREHSRTEMERLEVERDRRQTEIERSNRVLLYTAAGLGGFGLLALLLTPLFHWHTLQRMTELANPRSRLAAGTTGLITEGAGGLSDQTVLLSNQRLLSAIERMEQRVQKFEHAWSPTSPQPVVPPTTGGREMALFQRPTVTSDPSSRLRVLMAKGQSLLDVGKTMEAMSCYTDILRLDPNHPEALVKRGVALERLKQDDEAIQCYDQAIRSDRKMTLAYLHKGAVCNRLERYEEAVKCYEQALSVEAENEV